MYQSTARLKVLVAGLCSLIVMLGLARFSYTPMLPVMQQQAGLGTVDAGWLAAVNYVGYLGGAIIASLVSDLRVKDSLYRAGLIVAVLTTLMMGMSDDLWVWLVSRFFAGLSSAAGLLIGSGLVMHWLIHNGFRSELGIHFGGVGLGIATCAVLVELTLPQLNWSEQWYLMTVVAVLLVIPAWGWLPKPKRVTGASSNPALQDKPPSRAFLSVLMAAYFCAGVGYVVSATFIVAIFEELPAMAGKGSWSFMVMGLAAAPACILWDFVARRVGDINALISAFVLKIVAILIPVVSVSPLWLMFSAALFGASFLGIVSLVLSMSGRYFPTRPAKMMGKMTISYGIAQILAPALTGILAEQTGSYSAGLYLAAAVMMVGVGLMWVLRALEISASEKAAGLVVK